MIKSVFSLTLLALLFGCDRAAVLPAMIDTVAFENFGGTLFSEPRQMTLKEVHLDRQTEPSQGIIVEGSVVEVGKHLTYLVVDDKTARLLINLTDLDAVNLGLERYDVGLFVKFLGSVESGKKGLPFLKASAARRLGTSVQAL